MNTLYHRIELYTLRALLRRWLSRIINLSKVIFPEMLFKPIVFIFYMRGIKIFFINDMLYIYIYHTITLTSCIFFRNNFFSHAVYTNATNITNTYIVHIHVYINHYSFFLLKTIYSIFPFYFMYKSVFTVVDRILYSS